MGSPLRFKYWNWAAVWRQENPLPPIRVPKKTGNRELLFLAKIWQMILKGCEKKGLTIIGVFFRLEKKFIYGYPMIMLLSISNTIICIVVGVIIPYYRPGAW